MKIELLRDISQAPVELLCLADLSVEAVAGHLDRGDCCVGEFAGQIMRGYVLLSTRPFTVEFVDAAVAADSQGRGYGKQLVDRAVEQSRLRGFRTIEVGIGNSGVEQMALSRKCGFNMTHVDMDFFTRHYEGPVIDENGMECRYMVRLSQDI